MGKSEILNVMTEFTDDMISFEWTCEDNCGNAGAAGAPLLSPGNFLSLVGGSVSGDDFIPHNNDKPSNADETFQRSQGPWVGGVPVLSFDSSMQARDIFWHLLVEGTMSKFSFYYRSDFLPKHIRTCTLSMITRREQLRT